MASSSSPSQSSPIAAASDGSQSLASQPEAMLSRCGTAAGTAVARATATSATIRTTTATAAATAGGVTPLLVTDTGPALRFSLLAECQVSKARRTQIRFASRQRGAVPEARHVYVDTPVFMPVGTQGSMKGITVEQLEDIDCQIILGNTYHLGHRPGPEIMDKAGGLHAFMSWSRGLLTDSGGFQMVSLNELSSVSEKGVTFTSPHNATQMLLTPEESVGRLQAAIGADVVMQLDHVLHVLTDDSQINEATQRSIRWLDRGIKAHEPQKMKQNLFAIVQGGLNPELRRQCIDDMVQRKDKLPGFAIGGLSGGEAKSQFWRTVAESCARLPRDRPRYLMGVGFPVDLVVCTALGVDMFDCVYPTRTGRFGQALVPWGQVNLRLSAYETDFRPIDGACICPACSRGITRAWFHIALAARQANAVSLVSLHNLTYMLGMMRSAREAIVRQRFPGFVHDFFSTRCKSSADLSELKIDEEFDYLTAPADWTVEALASVGIDISDIGERLAPTRASDEGKVAAAVGGGGDTDSGVGGAIAMALTSAEEDSVLNKRPRYVQNTPTNLLANCDDVEC